jgi:hypothetical protein
VSADSTTLIIGVDRDIINRGVILQIAQSTGCADEALAIEGKTHNGAVFERSPDLVAFATVEGGGFEQLRQLRPIDVMRVALESYSAECRHGVIACW